MEKVSWKLIDTYFKDNPSNLIAHHLDSYNDFFKKGIQSILKEKNPPEVLREEVLVDLE